MMMMMMTITVMIIQVLEAILTPEFIVVSAAVGTLTPTAVPLFTPQLSVTLLLALKAATDKY